MTQRLLYIVVIIVFFSCQNEDLSDDEYVRYINSPKNGLFDQEEIGEYNLSIQYLPWQYIGLQNNSENTAYSVNQYYLLKLENKDGSQFPNKNMLSDEEYKLMIEYLSFDFDKSIYLLEENDTLSTNSFHFENSYGMTPHVSFLLSFPKSDKELDKKFCLESDYLSINKTVLAIKHESINKIPKLKR